jgi:hypothetical protein
MRDLLCSWPGLAGVSGNSGTIPMTTDDKKAECFSEVLAWALRVAEQEDSSLAHYLYPASGMSDLSICSPLKLVFSSIQIDLFY